MAGKAAVEAVLLLSVRQVAGPKRPGKATGDIGWHGRQAGVVSLSQRKLRIEKPRLRKKGKGAGKEVAIPAYDAMVANSRLGSRILDILMKGVSTREYKDILPQMADTVGVSKSEISREFIDASANELEHKANHTSIYRANNKKTWRVISPPRLFIKLTYLMVSPSLVEYDIGNLLSGVAPLGVTDYVIVGCEV